MINSIPPNKQWIASGRSDVLGSLYAAFNLNLTEQLGKTRVSPRMVITTNQVDGAGVMGCPVAFRGYAGDVFALAATVASAASHTGIYQCVGGILTTPFIVNAGAGGGATNFSNDYSDMEIFMNKIVVTGSDDALIYGDGVGWTAAGSHGNIISSILTANANHKLMNFRNVKRLLVFASLTQIISLDTTFTPTTSGTNTFNLANATASSDAFLISMIQTENLAWILTANFYNNECYVYTWDGVTADTYQNAYKIDARGVLAGIIKDTTPYIIDTEGRLMYFAGGGFVPAPNGQLPIKQSTYLTNPLSQKNDRWIHPNGISIVDGRINVLINNLNHDNLSTTSENIASGVWEYDPTIGWYHKKPLTLADLSVANPPTLTDYGQNRLARVGALFNLNKDDRSTTGVLGKMLAGAEYYYNATQTKAAIWTDDSLDTLQKYGYYITPKIFSSELKDSFRAMHAIVKKFLNATDKITVKIRTGYVVPTEVTVTWVNTTSFNTDGDISAYAVGDEVEGIAGQGSGRCAHIIDIVQINPSTKAVVLDDTLGTGNAVTAKVRFQHWKKLGVDFMSQTLDLNSWPDLSISTVVQIKLCMLFTGDNELLNTLLDTVPRE